MNKIDRIRSIKNLAISYRGNVLEKMSFLEKVVDNYIIYHFTNKDEDKTIEMQLLIFGDNRVTFENKKQIFHSLASAHDLQWYRSYKSLRNLKANKGSIPMNSDLTHCIEQRNIFAHCIVDTSVAGINRIKPTEVGFVRFKNKEETVWYDEQKINLLLKVIDNVMAHINKKITD